MCADKLKRVLKLNSCRRSDLINEISTVLDLLKVVNSENPRDETKLSNLRIRLQDLPDTYKSFLQLYDNIISIHLEIEDDVPTVETDLLMDVKGKYYECISLASNLGLTSNPVVNNVQGGNIQDLNSPKLAPIKLPQFSGDLNTFTQWHDLYTSMIHNNSKLSDISKFHYLLSSLSGQALALVKSIPFDSAHYQIAFDTLITQYKNDRLLAIRYLDNILNAKPVKCDDPASLEAFNNVFSENVSALMAMNIPKLGEFILFYLGTRLIDSDTLKYFELEHKKENFPTADILKTFLRTYVNVVKTSRVFENKSKSKTSNSKLVFHSSSPSVKSSYNSNSKSKTCVCCSKGYHGLSSCYKFKSMSVKSRVEFIKNNKHCFNCLQDKHLSKDCPSDKKCRCNLNHHQLLCFKNDKSDSDKKSTSDSVECEPKDNKGEGKNVHSMSCSFDNNKRANVLLGTVIVNVKDRSGRFIRARCLIDSGSMSCFCTKYFYKRLGLPIKFVENNCVGIGGTHLNTFSEAGNISISPVQNNNVVISTEVIIISQISSLLPPSQVPHGVSNDFSDLNLSDKMFGKPERVDILIGANIFSKILSDGAIVKKNNLVAFPTIFGYCVAGQVPCKSTSGSTTSVNLSLTSVNNDNNLSEAVNRFWELESVPTYSCRDPDEDLAEKQFNDLYFRSDDGTYNSPILVKPNINELGGSFDSAKLRLLRLEKSLNKNPKLRFEYNKFVKEYSVLGHMKRVELGSGKFYLPHHGVLKEDSTTTKLRVVFDGSAVSTSGISLNSCLYAGPKLNNDICDVMLRFRLHKVALVADICKMYRMVRIIPEHCVYQHILFRFSDSDPIEEWELVTNTQGLTSASYIAHKCVEQLQRDEGDNFPLAKSVVPRDLVVDNLCSGAKSVDAARELARQVVQLFSRGNFQMRKWLSNEMEALCDVPEDYLESCLNFDESDCGVKLLGTHWNSKSDCLSFHISLDLMRKSSLVTKRIVLSTTAKLFDPLGIAGPVVFFMKYFFQSLWKLKCNWDDSLDSKYSEQWFKCIESLHLLSKISVPRFVGSSDVPLDDVQLLGFCDASEKGFAAVVYIRCGKLDEQARVSLLMCKTKLAPIKKLTIPRLELLGAHLLKKLIVYVHNSLSLVCGNITVFAWTDSSIVLSWINTPLYRLKTFVCHRVADIVNSPVKIKYSHVNTEENPADVACRGLMPAELVDHRLWFESPPWCSEPQSMWSKGSFSVIQDEDLPELKHEIPIVAGCAISSPGDYSPIVYLINKISSFVKLKRVVAYVLRYAFNLRQRARVKLKMSNEDLKTGSLTVEDLRSALILCAKAVQSEHFSSELKLLENERESSKTISRLRPFIDEHGVLRVGGRLSHSALPLSNKNPILLPKKCAFTNSIIDHFHVSYLHVGPSTLVSILRRQLWILSARSIVRQRIHRCVTCVRYRGSTVQPIMGDLPSARVMPSRVFSHVGIDFAGPFAMKEHKRRGAKVLKCYLVVFVCLAVKAVHLEVVTEMSTVAFLSVLERFVARRGLPNDVYSDCGTNFKGTAKYLSDVYDLLKKGSDSISAFMCSKEIKWHFNSPSAPSMGGLWEAVVKSAKGHLRKTVGDRCYTYEELNTMFHRIEAMLNSRPLTLTSTDPGEVDVLTPGHFLTGGPLVSIPEPCLLDEKEGILKRWQHIKQLTQSFWSKWSCDYLNSLQERSKWHHEVPNLTPGAVVFVKGENTLPSSWPMARVESVYPGSDSVVRVVDIRIGDRIFRRPVNKLVLLPTCV